MALSMAEIKKLEERAGREHCGDAEIGCHGPETCGCDCVSCFVAVAYENERSFEGRS